MTVENISEPEFVTICQKLGVTPLKVRNHILGRDEFLTSSTGVPMKKISAVFRAAGATVVREKIEVMKRHHKAAYYETHELKDRVDGCQSTVYNLNKGTCRHYRTRRSSEYTEGWEAAVLDTNVGYDGMKEDCK